jgi:hypothetical protein
MRFMARDFFVCTLAVVALGVAGALPAQAPLAVSPDVRHEVVDRVASLVERHFVVADSASIVADHLRERAHAGAFDDAATLSQLAALLTRAMQEASGDWHMSVRFDQTLAENLGTEASEAQAMARREMEERERRANYHVEAAERLDGNVGYLRLGLLSTQPEAFRLVEHALHLLQHTDAVILDLRDVPGGSAAMANFLISHFTGPDIRSLGTYSRASGETTYRHTLAEVPGPRRPHVPLYVLVSGRSASAAEDVPFVLQNLGRATIVGETTRGAGRNNRHFDAGHGLVASISVTRVFDPETQREWEGRGVQPDIEVSPDEAQDAALLHARRAIADGGSESPGTCTDDPAGEYALTALLGGHEVEASLEIDEIAGAHHGRIEATDMPSLRFWRACRTGDRLVLDGENLSGGALRLDVRFDGDTFTGEWHASGERAAVRGRVVN